MPAAEVDLTLDQGTEARWNFLALQELQSRICYCGAEKRAGQTLCPAEYKALPLKMQKALYKRIGQGYREAYLAAREYLAEPKGGAR